MEAAQRWAAAKPVEQDRTVQDLVEMGADDATIEAARAQIAAQGIEPADADLEVYPENWEALMVFLRMQTRWDIGPSGHRIGMKYPDLETVMRRRKVKNRDAMFEQIQTMEIAALEAINGDQ